MISNQYLKIELEFWAQQDNKLIRGICGFNSQSITADACHNLKVGHVIRSTNNHDKEPDDRVKAIDDAMKELTARQKEIIRLEYCGKGGRKLKAFKYKITVSNYGKILCEAMKRLRLGMGGI